MLKRTYKIIDILILIFILVVSVVIFINNESLEQAGNVSYIGLFVLCFLANATVLLPSPSLILAASFALILNPLAVALVAAFGSTLGEFVGYIFGNSAKDVSLIIKTTLDKINKKVKNQAIFVFILAVLPLPLFDVAGIYSGGTKMNWFKFFLACYVGKFIKLLFYINFYKIIENTDFVTNILGGF